MNTAAVSLERMRVRARSRQAPIHDWRTTLLPAAAEARVAGRAMQLCKALCDHQRGRFPEVIVGSEELAEELGMDRRHLWRSTHQLVRAGLLLVIEGGGKMPASKVGRANVYQLGPACGKSLEAVLDSAPKMAQSSAPKMAQYPRRIRSQNSAENGAPPFGLLRNPSGDRGERTVALTGDPPAPSPSPTIAPHRFRDLLRGLNAMKPRGQDHA